MKETNKPLPPTFLTIYLLGAIILHFIFPITYLLRGPVTLLGILPIIGGIVLNIWADNLFSRNSTTVKPYEKPSTFISKGPFRFSRHPMYLGMALVLFGVAILLGSLVAFFAPVAMIGMDRRNEWN